MPMPRKLTASLVALLLAAAPALADSHLAQAVKARQGIMNFYAMNLGVLGAMAKGDRAYDAAAATRAAANIAAVAGTDQSMLWPEGSDEMAMDGSRALPDIWANMGDVGAKAGDFVQAAMAMETAAGTDLAALQEGMKALGGACGACHKAYRAPE